MEDKHNKSKQSKASSVSSKSTSSRSSASIAAARARAVCIICRERAGHEKRKSEVRIRESHIGSYTRSITNEKEAAAVQADA